MALIQNTETGAVSTDFEFIVSQIREAIAQLRNRDPELADDFERNIEIDEARETFCYRGTKSISDLMRALYDS